METRNVPFSELLTDVIDNRGKTCPTSEGGIPLIATNCIRNDLLYPAYDKVRYVSQETFRTWFRGHPKPGDLIFVTKGTPGRVCIAPDPVNFCIAQDMVAVRADKKKIDPKYLFALLRSERVQQQIEQMHVGTLIPHFKKGDFDKLFLPVPDRFIQEIIGRIYFQLSYKMELNQRMNEALEAIARAIFKSWFVDFDPVRTPSGTASSALRDLFPHHLDPTTGLPLGWKFPKLSDVCTTQYGFTATATDVAAGPKLLRVTDINKADWINWNSVPHCNIDDAEFERYRLRYGDIVVARMADPGKAALITDEVPAVFASYLVRLKTASLAHSFYIYGFLKSDLYREYSEGARSGSVQANMNAQVIVGASLVWPSDVVLERFREVVEPLRRKIASNLREAATLAQIRDSLLPKLISGEIRLKEADKSIGALV